MKSCPFASWFFFIICRNLTSDQKYYLQQSMELTMKEVMILNLLQPDKVKK